MAHMSEPLKIDDPDVAPVKIAIVPAYTVDEENIIANILTILDETASFYRGIKPTEQRQKATCAATTAAITKVTKLLLQELALTQEQNPEFLVIIDTKLVMVVDYIHTAYSVQRAVQNLQPLDSQLLPPDKLTRILDLILRSYSRFELRKRRAVYLAEIHSSTILKLYVLMLTTISNIGFSVDQYLFKWARQLTHINDRINEMYCIPYLPAMTSYHTIYK